MIPSRTACSSRGPTLRCYPAVKTWLARNPRITPALHPDLGIVAEHGRDLLRDHHPSSHPPWHLRLRRDLIKAITAFIDGWNKRCRPFVWTKDADAIIAKAHRKAASDT